MFNNRNKRKPDVSPWRVGISAGLGYFLMTITTQVLGIDYYMPRDGIFNLRFALDFVLYLMFIYIVNFIIGKLYFDKRIGESKQYKKIKE